LSVSLNLFIGKILYAPLFQKIIYLTTYILYDVSVSFSELKVIKVAGWLEVNFDLYWEPKPASEIEIIRRAHRWTEGGAYV
jgi:hypothetical protein